MKRAILKMLAYLRRGTQQNKPQGGYGGMPKPPRKDQTPQPGEDKE